MEPDDRLESILDAWQEAFERGTDIPASELCRDCGDLIPEVARRIELIRRMAGLQPRGDADPTLSGVIPPDTATLSQSGTPEKHSSQAIAAPAGYEILDEIGRGGMGVVYKARQLSLNRVVALKMVLGGVRARSADLIRFRTEGEAVARLTHPNVVQVHEVGTHDGSPYLTLEYCERGSLDELLQASPLEPRRAAELMLALAQAVHAAHQAGIVHRDLKPANILLTADGTPKVSDFGLAKWADAGDGLTVTGAVVGTPSYMAPEQASGNMKALDRRADVYALGAILYTCLTGRPPFKGATPLDTLDQVRSTEPARVRDLQPGVPRDLETICLKCLQKGSDRRYISAAALADDLQRFLDRRPIQARPVSSFERSWRWCRRNPAVATLLVGVVLSSLTGTAVAMWYAEAADTRRQQAEGAERDAKREKDEADIARGIALREKADADIARLAARQSEIRAQLTSARVALDYAHMLGEQGHAASGLLWLVRGLDTAVRAGDTELEWVIRMNITAFHAHLCEAAGPPLRHTGLLADVAVSQDGRFIATASYDRTVRIWNADTGSPVGPVLEHPDSVHSVAFSPDGMTLASGTSKGAVYFWDRLTGRVKSNFQGHQSVVPALTFNPAGTRVATAGWDGQVVLWDVESGRPAASVHLPAPAETLAFRPDGAEFLVGDKDGIVRRCDANSGEVRTEFRVSPAGQFVFAVAYSPDGRLFASGCSDRTVRFWDAQSGKAVGRALQHVGFVQGVAFSPDGKTLVSTGNDATARLWEVATGLPVGAPIQHRGSVVTAVFSPDGRTIVTACEDMTARRWRIPSGQRTASPLRHARLVGLTLDPTGQSLMTAGDGSVMVRNLTGPAPVGTTIQIGGRVSDAKMTPEGSKVLLGFQNGRVELRSLRSGESSGFEDPRLSQVQSVAISPDGRKGATGSWDGSVRLWNLERGLQFQAAVTHPSGVFRVAFSPDGKLLAVSTHGNAVYLWNADTAEQVGEPLPHNAPVFGLTFSPDGRWLVTGSGDRTARAWAVSTRQPVGSVLEHRSLVNQIAFHPGGRLIVTEVSDSGSQLWDTITGKRIGPVVPRLGNARGVTFTPSGKGFVTGDGGGWCQFWATPTVMEGEPRHLSLWAEVVSGLELSEDGVVRELSGEVWQERRERYWSTDRRTASPVIAVPRREIAPTPRPVSRPPTEPTAVQQLSRANSLVKSNDLGGALAAAREAVRLAPQNSMTHHTLGHVLWTRGELDEAVAAFRAGLALPSAEAQERICLGRVLQARGDWAEAVDVLDAASRLNPPPANAHRYLGLALVAAGQPDRAIVACREAVRRAAQDANAHAGLGLALRAQGKLPDALDSLKTALKLNPKSTEFQRYLRQTERWVAFDRRLSKLRDGTDKPATPTEAVEIAFFCQQPCRKQFDMASWLYRGAFAAEPKLLSRDAWRYNAACAAVQLAAGSDPTARIDLSEWHLLQSQARAWLAADLATYARLVSGATPAERATIRQTLSRWLRDPDLLPTRAPAALAAMPATERVAWEKHWAEVAAVIESTRPAVAPPPHAVARPFPR